MTSWLFVYIVCGLLKLKKYTELNRAALNVNKPCVTPQKTACLKDNKVENAENEYAEKLWLPNLIFISFYFIHFSRLNSISIILFWENTGSASEN